jgi:formate/nitrite transporter FocA (FNT family)
MKRFFDIFRSAVLAGIAISLGGMVYLKTGSELSGAIMFSFGLLTVVHYGMHLYTGKAGFFAGLFAPKTLFKSGNVDIKATTSLADLLLPVLIGNAVGCLICGMLCWQSAPDIVTNAQALVNGRLTSGLLNNFLLAIPCGFIMTTAVTFGRDGKYLPLLFGVPLFIVCGFRHSIADAFYYSAASLWSYDLLWTWLVIVAGNFVGCNLYRVVAPNN